VTADTPVIFIRDAATPRIALNQHQGQEYDVCAA